MKNFSLLLLMIPLIANSQSFNIVNWTHYSTAKSDMNMPLTGKEQTASLIADIDNDGIPEIFISERTNAPSLVMFKMEGDTWAPYIIEDQVLPISAGATFGDITGNGYMDIVFLGDHRSNEVWWWENPYPELNSKTPWKRRLIKKDGLKYHHDVIFGDFTGDGKNELVFWNQRANKLLLADIPKDVKNAVTWNYRTIFEYSGDSEMEQHGHEFYAIHAPWKRVNDHEGLIKFDIDGDGLMDIVGAGLWFKHKGDGTFLPNYIDTRYTFSRTAAGQLIEGSRPEVVMVAGDGLGPLMMYEWKPNQRTGGTWFATVLIEEILNGHSLEVLDFNNDGHFDIFVAEMRLSGDYPEAKARILLGDGKGNFKEEVITTGFGHHESRLVDLNGNGHYDLVGKPYNWETPRLDIFINKGNF